MEARNNEAVLLDAGERVVSFEAVATRSAAMVQMRANHEIEGFRPDAQDLVLQRRYAAGDIGITEMLNAAREFAMSRMGARRPFDPKSTLVH